MVQLGLLRVKADSAHRATPGGPAKQEAQTVEAAPGGSAAEAAMQLSTGDAAPQQPAAALVPEAAAGAAVGEEPVAQPAKSEQSLANGDVSGGAADAPAAPAPGASEQLGAAEGDAEDVDVDMDIDPTSGAKLSCCYRLVAFNQRNGQDQLQGGSSIYAKFKGYAMHRISHAASCYTCEGG